MYITLYFILFLGKLLNFSQINNLKAIDLLQSTKNKNTLLLIVTILISFSLKLEANPILNYQFLKKSSPNTNGTNFAKNKQSRVSEQRVYGIDSSGSSARFKQLFSNGKERMTAIIELDDYNNEMGLVVYNMLGKEVLEIYRGYPKKGDEKFEFSTVTLPNGIYLCVLYFKGIRKAEKFIISR